MRFDAPFESLSSVDQPAPDTPAPVAMLLRNEQVGLALPSWFFPMTDSEAMAVHVAKLESDELAEWEKRVVETEELKGSQRATDLLRLRRKS